MGKALAIKGHKTRGKEVIVLLEMLGGSNINNLSGDNSSAYYINGHQNIIRGIDYIFGYEDMQLFSIEKFLEKYPYKVGDKVHIYVQNDDIDGRYDIEVAEITSMRWDPVRCKIAYEMKDINREFYKEKIKGKVDDNSNKQSECEKCGLHYGSVQCFDKDFCPHNKPKSYAVGLMDDKVNECESNKEIVMNENKPLFKPGDVVKLKGCPDKNLYWIVMDVIKDGYIFNDGKKYLFDVQHNYEKSNREVINLQPDKIASLSINNEKYADQIEIDLGDNYEYKFEMNKLYIVKKKPTYPMTYDECCEVLSIPSYYKLKYSTYEHDYHEYTTSKKLCLLQDNLNKLGKLLICRDAYWKIAGKQMGLDKPWEPDWNDLSTKHEFILINKGRFTYSSRLLVFPTVEMRDAFYDNFRKLIEQCKELL